MTDTMKGILSRVLLQEIAHQEIWAEKELERFGEPKIRREEIIAEIRKWMKDIGVEFRDDFYIQEF